MRLSDPKHFDHILPFLQPADVHHSIPLSSADIVRMHAHDDAGELGAGKDVGDVEEQSEVQTQRRGRAIADSGEKTPQVQEDVAPPVRIADAGEPQCRRSRATFIASFQIRGRGHKCMKENQESRR